MLHIGTVFDSFKIPEETAKSKDKNTNVYFRNWFLFLNNRCQH